MRILLADDHPLFREGVKPVLMKLAAEVGQRQRHRRGVPGADF